MSGALARAPEGRRHLFDALRYCRKCGLPAEFIQHHDPCWSECFLPEPSPQRWAIIRSGAWRFLPEFQRPSRERLAKMP